MDREVKSYRLDPALFEPTLRRRTRRRIGWALPSLVVVSVPLLALMTRLQPRLAESLPFSLPVVVACLAFGMFRSARVARRNGKLSWDSYRLELSERGLRRSVSYLPVVELSRAEVTRILESPGEGLSVLSADRSRFVFIPEQLEGYATVREQLAAWRSFERPRAGRAQAVQMAWTLLLLALWVATGLLPDLRLALLAGLGLLVVGAISIRETLRVGISDRRYRTRVVGVLCFFMCAPFARLLLHWIGAAAN